MNLDRASAMLATLVLIGPLLAGCGDDDGAMGTPCD
jgi:hypothetical protein